jgi:hypothetical protein
MNGFVPKYVPGRKTTVKIMTFISHVSTFISEYIGEGNIQKRFEMRKHLLIVLIDYLLCVTSHTNVFTGSQIRIPLRVWVLKMPTFHIYELGTKINIRVHEIVKRFLTFGLPVF